MVGCHQFLHFVALFIIIVPHIVAHLKGTGTHRYNAAATVMKDMLVVHGGETVPGCTLSSMAAFDVLPVLDVFSGALPTCTSVKTFRAPSTASWLPGWHMCSSNTGPISMHSMVHYASTDESSSSSTSDVLLMFGGLVHGTIVRFVPAWCPLETNNSYHGLHRKQ
jgi:hypothetical protein